MKAIMLLSGGLDSLLAARVILDQGIELEALNFVTVFCNCTPKGRSCSSAASAVRQLGIGLKTLNNSRGVPGRRPQPAARIRAQPQPVH